MANDNIITGPNMNRPPVVRSKCKLTGLRIEFEITDLYGQIDHIHATHLANETLSPNVEDRVTIKPKEAPRLGAAIIKQLLEMIEQRYILP